MSDLNNNIRSNWITKILGFLLLLFIVIPVGPILGMPLAPINYLFILIFIRVIQFSQIIFNKLNISILIIIFSMFAYLLLSSYLNYFKFGEHNFPLGSYKHFLSILFFLTFNNDTLKEANGSPK